VCEYTPAEGAVVGVAEAAEVVSGSSVPEAEDSCSPVTAGRVAGGETLGGDEVDRFSPDAYEHAAVTAVLPHVGTPTRIQRRHWWRRRIVAISPTVGRRTRWRSSER